MSDTTSSPLPLPDQPNLPLFVYGALKPGMPAYAKIEDFVDQRTADRVAGSIYVRDGLPMWGPSGSGSIEGFLLRWKPGEEEKAYEAVGSFEPAKHYKWSQPTCLESGKRANILEMRHTEGAERYHIEATVWRITDDPAFGPGLEAVQEVVDEIDRERANRGCEESDEPDYPSFFKSQMAYLLLWSILERLSVLCYGEKYSPSKRPQMLYQHKGMKELIAKHVKRPGEKIADTRDPSKRITLDPENPKKSFEFYYLLRSNLTHRGKGVKSEFPRIHSSLKELLAITRDYIKGLEISEISDGLTYSPHEGKDGAAFPPQIT